MFCSLPPPPFPRFIPEMNLLLRDIHGLMKAGRQGGEIQEKLSPWNQALLSY